MGVLISPFLLVIVVSFITSSDALTLLFIRRFVLSFIVSTLSFALLGKNFETNSFITFCEKTQLFCLMHIGVFSLFLEWRHFRKHWKRCNIDKWKLWEDDNWGSDYNGSWKSSPNGLHVEKMGIVHLVLLWSLFFLYIQFASKRFFFSSARCRRQQTVEFLSFELLAQKHIFGWFMIVNLNKIESAFSKSREK